MRLDVLPDRSPQDAGRAVALYERARAEYCALGLETETIDLGTALCTPSLARLHDANWVFDACVPRGSDAETMWNDAVAHFEARGARIWKCRPNISVPAEEAAPLVELLTRRNWQRRSIDVLRLIAAPTLSDRTDGPRIISARAAMPAYERFARAVAEPIEPQLAEFSLTHLDDPRYEVLVVIESGQVLGRAGLLSLSEIGLIEQVVVLPSARRRGFARALVERIIDLCARSQFRHVLLGCDADNAPAQALYALLGFAKAGESVTWFDPAIAAPTGSSAPA